MESKTILFDVDGVLIDTMPIWDNSANLYLKEVHHIEAPRYVDQNCTTLSLLEAGEYILSLYPQIERTPRQIADEVAAFIRERYVKVGERPQMVETIKTLKASSYQMYLATASEEENVEGALRNLGVWDCFEDIFTCTAIGYSKSYVAYYEEVAKRIEVPCNQLVMVEDSLHSMVTAKEAGLTVVGVYEELSVDKQDEICAVCDTYLHSLGELPLWLKEREKLKR